MRIAISVLCAIGGLTACDRAPSPAAPIRGEPIRSAAGASNGASSAGREMSRSLTGGPERLGFDRLSRFKFRMPDESAGPATNDLSYVNSQIPAEVKNLDGRRVALRGFMLPLRLEAGAVSELLLLRDQSMCCYGAAPNINEWVSVKMGKNRVKPIMDEPVTLVGTLHVGEMRENGYLVGIYHMDGEKLISE